MGLIAPRDKGFIGGITKLKFDQPVSNLDIRLNGVCFHAEDGDAGPSETFSVDLNGIAPDTSLTLDVSYRNSDGTMGSESVAVRKPRHDLGAMGATVIRVDSEIDGVFFKLWLPKVKRVFIRGSFNGWKDINRLDQLDDSGYWYGFSCDARPGDDYRFFVYGLDGVFDEVSDPAARETIKTRYNEPNDAQDANAVIIDPAAFQWRHDGEFADEREDFRKMVIYQAHWGTFLRTGSGDLPYETFVTQEPGASLDEKRNSVRRKLQYVQDLGFTALELLPIHEANGDKNAGYDPSFFFAVETTYGSPDDLRTLVDEAHGIGLAVIVDSVINHLTADPTRSSFSQEFIRGWYIRENAPWSSEKQFGTDWGADPDYERREIRHLLTDCMLMYIDEYHVDGIRFDATTTIPRDALKQMINSLRGNSRTSGKYLIAEHITDDPLPYIVGDIGFHGGWYKPAFYAAIGGILQRLGRGDLDSVRKVFETDYQGEPTTAIKYPTGSHDEIWVSHRGSSTATRLGGSGDPYVRMKMRLGWSLAGCSLGTPMMFMGTECLEDAGWDNSSGYGDMNWYPETGSNGANFKQMIRDINHLRNDHSALRGGNIDAKLVHWDNDNGVVAYKRWDQSGGVFLIVINVSDRNWGSREYQVQSDTPNSVWHECFNSQYVNYGGWSGACNSDPGFSPRAGGSGMLQGINLAEWCLLILRKMH